MKDEELELKAKESFNNKLQKDVCYCTYNEEKIYKDGYIAGTKENSVVWHKQSDTDDILDACNDWCVHHFVCKMKDGSYNIAFGICDEDCNGGVNVHIYFEYKDSEYYLDDIIAWIEIPNLRWKNDR